MSDNSLAGFQFRFVIEDAHLKLLMSIIHVDQQGFFPGIDASCCKTIYASVYFTNPLLYMTPFVFNGATTQCASIRL